MKNSPPPAATTPKKTCATARPATSSMDDADLLDSSLGFPAAEAGKIDGAASLVHMMNLNTFTCGAFHVKDRGDVAALCASLRENILDRHWMCGFPDKLVIVTVGDYVVSVYGYTDLVDTLHRQARRGVPERQNRERRPDRVSADALFRYPVPLLLSPVRAARLLHRAAKREKRRSARRQPLFLRLGRAEIPALHGVFHRAGVCLCAPDRAGREGKSSFSRSRSC